MHGPDLHVFFTSLLSMFFGSPLKFESMLKLFIFSIVCEDCGEKFANKHRLEIHSEMVHLNGKKPYLLFEIIIINTTVKLK